MKKYRAILRVSHSFLRWHSPLALIVLGSTGISFYMNCAHWLCMWIWAAPYHVLSLSLSRALSISPAVGLFWLCTLYILYHQLCIPSKFVCISSWMLFTFMLVHNFSPWHAKSIFAYHSRIYATETEHSKCTPVYCQMCGISKLRLCMHIIAYYCPTFAIDGCRCHWPASSSNDKNANHFDWLYHHRLRRRRHHHHWFE